MQKEHLASPQERGGGQGKNWGEGFPEGGGSLRPLEAKPGPAARCCRKGLCINYVHDAAAPKSEAPKIRPPPEPGPGLGRPPRGGPGAGARGSRSRG